MKTVKERLHAVYPICPSRRSHQTLSGHLFLAFALAVPFRAVDYTFRDKQVRDAKQNK